ncbi:membrane protein [Longimycelium tulufanense]|uniref:Membrane protein n=1 Tax=Longimycelium tulufanense TaxID=907463 RepID=A0A8J3C9L2_9PSEU|nr:membrane protein [Longimycelium tulufanense]
MLSVLSLPATRFRIIAVAEALSWLGLLTGMLFKYVVASNEIGVKIFGPIHGALFLIYVLIALSVREPLGWDRRTTIWALVASVPPLGTVVFERWATRKGGMGEPVPELAHD